MTLIQSRSGIRRDLIHIEACTALEKANYNHILVNDSPLCKARLENERDEGLDASGEIFKLRKVPSPGHVTPSHQVNDRGEGEGEGVDRLRDEGKSGECDDLKKVMRASNVVEEPAPRDPVFLLAASLAPQP